MPCPSAELADPADVTLGHKSVQRWNLPGGWVVSNRPAHSALVSDFQDRHRGNTLTPAANALIRKEENARNADRPGAGGSLRGG